MVKNILTFKVYLTSKYIELSKIQMFIKKGIVYARFYIL